MLIKGTTMWDVEKRLDQLQTFCDAHRIRYCFEGTVNKYKKVHRLETAIWINCGRDEAAAAIDAAMVEIDKRTF